MRNLLFHASRFDALSPMAQTTGPQQMVAIHSG
jgi:hypothetical protein